jgi:uncharacterized membrane protein
VAIVFALLAAMAYGTSDFAAGVASRKFDAGPVTAVAQALGVLTAVVAVILFPGAGSSERALEWGSLSGLGSAMGTLSLYHGLAVARMSVVATLSAVLTAVIPALVGVALGNGLSLGAGLGVVIALPAIALVSRQHHADDREAAHAGVAYGALSGVGFALLFIALDRAGTHAGAWPLVPGQVVSVLLIGPFAYRGLRRSHRPSRAVIGLIIGAGVLSGTANLLFLAATGNGQLAIVAVLAALYPAVTVIMARLILAERWTALQATGLCMAGIAIILVTTG